MTKSEMTQLHEQMSADDGMFDRWLKANGVLGSMFAAALVAMAMAAPNLTPSQARAQAAQAMTQSAQAMSAQAMTQSGQETEFSAAQRQSEPRQGPTIQDLTIELGPTLPVQQVDEPF